MTVDVREQFSDEGAPQAGDTLTEVHAWIGTQPDGGEGILSADFTIGAEVRHMPLFATQLEMAVALEPFAARVCAFAQASGRQVNYRMVTFRRVADA